jgi:hypothetical protein
MNEEEKKFIRNWIRWGVAAGILGDLAYASVIAPVPLPVRVRMLLGFAFGPLLCVAFIGLYHFFKLHKKSVALQAATLFGVISGVLVNLMLVVQSAIFLTIPREARAELGLAFDGLNMVQLGMDVSWDIFFSLATILLAVAMFSHPQFGILWGGFTFLIGGGLLLLNLATFPIPPAQSGSFDLGPVSGALYLFIALRILSSSKWVEARLEDRLSPENI